MVQRTLNRCSQETARNRVRLKISGHEHGLVYHFNRTAWMTSSLFHDWLKHFDQHFKFFLRKVLLSVDNCSAHGLHETAPQLKNVEQYFLSQNTTSKIQPCDTGIFETSKMWYRRYQMDRALDMAEDENIKDIYKADVLSAMLTWKRIWNQVSLNIISNCLRHTGILGTDATTVRVSVPEKQLQH